MSDHTPDSTGKRENTLQPDTKLTFLHQAILTSVFLGSQGMTKELIFRS